MSYRLSRAEELSAISWPGLIEDRNLFVKLRRLGTGASCILTSTFLAVVLVDSVDLNFGEPDWETQFLTGVPWIRKLLAPAILI